MSLLIAGIDEAGYGPMLGPLCVGAAALRVHQWRQGDKTPDLWSLLRRAVARNLKNAGRRIVIADSKQLKLPNDSKTRHPLTHLERGVLTAARCASLHAPNDQSYFQALGVDLGPAPWYQGPPTPLPQGCEPQEIAIASNLLANALAKADVEFVSLACEVVTESRLNDVIHQTGSKAEANLQAVGAHLRRLLHAHPDQPIMLVCDRLGGRVTYADFLSKTLGDPPRIIEESPRASRYEVGPHARVVFAPEGERRALSVALASMIAKCSRELAMARFNRYWTSRVAELKPTAGYYADARRWLADASGAMTPQERAAVVRIA